MSLSRKDRGEKTSAQEASACGGKRLRGQELRRLHQPRRLWRRASREGTLYIRNSNVSLFSFANSLPPREQSRSASRAPFRCSYGRAGRAPGVNACPFFPGGPVHRSQCGSGLRGGSRAATPRKLGARRPSHRAFCGRDGRPHWRERTRGAGLYRRARGGGGAPVGAAAHLERGVRGSAPGVVGTRAPTVRCAYDLMHLRPDEDRYHGSARVEVRRQVLKPFRCFPRAA